MATGEDLVSLAAQHIGEQYVRRVLVPKDNAKWKGPWECAEFASWCLYQVSNKLFGCDSRQKPSTAKADTKSWYSQAKAASSTSTIVVAKSTPGAFLLRLSTAQLDGHIAISDGTGHTIEAHSTATGVIRGAVDGRRWDMGVLPPMIAYNKPTEYVPTSPPSLVLRLKTSNMKGALVERLQHSLADKGFIPGDFDGVYGPHTATAVHAFQLTQGLLADGEAGEKTLQALGLI
jgi:hypothetical protein